MPDDGTAAHVLEEAVKHGIRGKRQDGGLTTNLAALCCVRHKPKERPLRSYMEVPCQC